MAIKAKLGNLIRAGVNGVQENSPQLRNQLNVDLVLSVALRHSDLLAEVRHPVEYVDFLRTSIERSAHDVVEVKSRAGLRDEGARRFATLVEQLKRGLPPVDFAVVQEIALIADRNRSLSEPMEFGEASGDVGMHFELSSSFGRKGRILYNVVRFTRSKNCLELGTAYGMSALFILAAMKAYAKAGKLTTVEAWEPMFSISSSMLKHLHAESVSSHFGKSEQALAELAQQLDRVDFMFHDAGHLGEDYVNDFRQACDMLAPGAVVLFDDIRWEDRTVHSGATGAYRGWKEVVNHARVSQAFEIDNDLGLLLLN